MADVRGRFSRFRRSLHPLSDLHPLLARLDGSHARVRCLVASFGTTSGHYPVGLWHRRRWLGLCDVGCAHYRNVPSQAASSAVWRGSRMVLATPSSLPVRRSEEHTSELQSLMRLPYAVLCLKKKHL